MLIVLCMMMSQTNCPILRLICDVNTSNFDSPQHDDFLGRIGQCLDESGGVLEGLISMAPKKWLQHSIGLCVHIIEEYG